MPGAIFTPLVQPVVTNMGWRAGEVLVSALMLLFCLPAILLVPSTDPADLGLVPLGTEDAPTAPTPQGKKPKIEVDRMLFAGAVLYAVLSAAVSAMPQHFPGLAEEMGLSAGVGAAMISVCMVANTVGKVVMGWLTDHIGARASIMAYIGDGANYSAKYFY